MMHRAAIVLLAFCLFLWTSLTVLALSPAISNASPPPVPLRAGPTPTPAVINPSGDIKDEDWAPGLALFAIIFFLICLILFGIGIVIGIFLVALVSILVMVGILSSSVVIGFVQRRMGGAFTAFFVQFGAAMGVPSGVLFLGLLALLLRWPIGLGLTLVWGGLAGLLSGALIGLLLSLVCRWSYQWLARLIQTKGV